MGREKVQGLTSVKLLLINLMSIIQPKSNSVRFLVTATEQIVRFMELFSITYPLKHESIACAGRTQSLAFL